MKLQSALIVCVKLGDENAETNMRPETVQQAAITLATTLKT